MTLHRLHIMPCTMLVELYVNVSVALKDHLGPFMRMTEQLVTYLKVLHRLR